MSLFIRQYYKFILPVIIILAGFGIFLQQVEVKADTCDGEWIDGTPASGVNCGYNCNDHNGNETMCSSEAIECAGNDSASHNGPPDGIGDDLHWCQWDNGDCQNIFSAGDKFVTYNGGNVNFTTSYTWHESVCYDPWEAHDSCEWAVGSYMVKRAFCNYYPGAEIKPLLNSHPQQQCVDDVNNLFDFKQLVNWPVGSATWSWQMPGNDGAHDEGGYCRDWCDQNNGYVIDYGKCTVNEETVPGWDAGFCPNDTYTNHCGGVDQNGDSIGDTLYTYTCGTYNHITNTSDCYVPGPTPICDNICGTVDNSANDTCIDGGLYDGRCLGDGSSADCFAPSSHGENLDDSDQSGINDYNAYCTANPPAGGWTGDIQWKQGATFGAYGEYNNRVSGFILTAEGDTYNIYTDRDSWRYEACGDDQDEINLGIYCCDDPTDQIIALPDPVADDYVQTDGDYCIQYNECGNFIKEGTEECDAYYDDYETLNLDTGEYHLYQNHLYLGDGCIGEGNYCLPPGDANECTCSGTVFNEDGDLFIITNGDVTDDNNILLKMDDTGIFLIKGTVMADIWPGNNLDDIGTDTEKYVIQRDNGTVIMYVDQVGNLHLPTTGGILLEDPVNVPINDRLMVWQDNGNLLGVLRDNGYLYIKNYIVENGL